METVIFRRKALKACLGLCSAVEGRQVRRVKADVGQTGGRAGARVCRAGRVWPRAVALKELRCDRL